jgi:hypothetical protein
MEICKHAERSVLYSLGLVSKLNYGASTLELYKVIRVGRRVKESGWQKFIYLMGSPTKGHYFRQGVTERGYIMVQNAT